MDQFSTDSLHGNLNDDAAFQRSGSRDSLLLSAQLRMGEGPDVTVRVRNLSSGGLMAEFAQPVVQGALVEVDVRGVGWIPGRIAWAAEGRIGIAFEREIDPMAARKPVGATRPASYTKPVKRAL